MSQPESPHSPRNSSATSGVCGDSHELIMEKVWVWADPDDAGAELTTKVCRSLRGSKGVRLRDGDVTDTYLPRHLDGTRPSWRRRSAPSPSRKPGTPARDSYAWRPSRSRPSSRSTGRRRDPLRASRTPRPTPRSDLGRPRHLGHGRPGGHGHTGRLRTRRSVGVGGVTYFPRETPLGSVLPDLFDSDDIQGRGTVPDASLVVARDGSGLVAILSTRFPRHGGEYLRAGTVAWCCTRMQWPRSSPR